MRFHEEFCVSMEINVGDEQMDSAVARSSEVDREDQGWSAYVTSVGRQDGDQERNAPAAIHQSETEEWSIQPTQPLQILDAPHPENNVPDQLWDWLNEDPP